MKQHDLLLRLDGGMDRATGASGAGLMEPEPEGEDQRMDAAYSVNSLPILYDIPEFRAGAAAAGDAESALLGDAAFLTHIMRYFTESKGQFTIIYHPDVARFMQSLSGLLSDSVSPPVSLSDSGSPPVSLSDSVLPPVLRSDSGLPPALRSDSGLPPALRSGSVSQPALLSE